MHFAGEVLKRDCHRWELIAQDKALHRAFSVFTFDSQQRLLLQQRSKYKVGICCFAE